MTPQQLRNSILQLAIEGKLVEQRPEEGTGEELYQLIQEEKQELIKVGKLKKQKNLPEIMKDEMPFLIPNTWRWVRLKEIVYNRGQKKTNNKILYIYNNNIIDAENAPSRARRIVDVGDILYSTVRPYLHNMCIIDSTSPFESIASTGLAAMTCYNKVYNKYLFYYLLSASFDQYANSLENSKGVAYPAINDERLYKAVIPLPPVDEQKRIVEKIEVIFPLIDRYEGVWHKLNELNKTFPETLQKSILQEAIQGKLCEQKDEDGSAKELIEKISLEKERLIESGQIKKHKALPAIQEDEIPFDIPSSWCWERLGNISTYNQTKPKIKAIDLDRLIWVLDLDDIEKNTGKILRYVKAKDKKVSGEKVVFHKGQILYSKLRPYLKKALIALEDGVCTPELVPFDIFGGCNRNYILSVLKSPYVDFGVNSATYGVKMPRVGVETMINLLIPIPPIREQERIVKKFDKSHSLIQRFKDLVFV